MTFSMIVLMVFGVRWLGHGLRVEAILAVICLIFGVSLFLWPECALDSKATVDLYWAGWGSIIGIPFLLKAALSGSGLVLNIVGYSCSQRLRYCGALVGSFIWTAMLWKYILYGSPLAFGSVCSGVFLFSSIGIIGMASANLPRPGNPGTL